jgi:hypothetical protein
MTPSILERTVTRAIWRLRILFLDAATLFWVGLTPLRNGLVDAGLVKSDSIQRSASVL